MIRPRPEVPPHDTVRPPRCGGTPAAARVLHGVAGLSSLPMQEFLSAIQSDAAGVVLRTGSAVRNWKPGDKVTVHCNYVDDQSPSSHDDSILADNQRIWGFETSIR